MRYLFTLWLLFFAGLMLAQEQVYRVIAQPRLNLRSQPNLQSRILAKATYGDRILAYSGHYGRAKIQARDGVWKKVKFRGQDGFMFSAYLEKLNSGIARTTTPKSPPKVWALVVGVSQYRHAPSLRYSDDDAYLIYSFLKSPEGGALPDQQVQVLVDENATLANIQKAMNKLGEQASSRDLVLFYFSGHGLPGAFLPADFDGKNNALQHEKVKQWLADSGAKHKLCIADACHSGSFRSIDSRGPSKYYEALAEAGEGTAILLSSRAEEASIEVNGLRQGVFSHYLLKGLKGAADQNHDRLVTIGELYQFTSRAVRRYTKSYQSPTIQGKFDQDMPLATIRP